jgi:cellulose synthase/poly-beta-1,6-N-acetylglucosamine synthase-like glycosyltransferase
MVLIIAILLGFGGLLYLTALLLLRYGINLLKPGTAEATPFVSVVIAARNEQENLKSCLEALLRQDYPAPDYEIIVVDDRSSDGTPDILHSMAQNHSTIRPLRIQTRSPEMAPKKQALNRGIEEAKGMIILTTDADCIPPSGWIRSMVRCFSPQTGLAAGFSPLTLNIKPGLFPRILALESAGLASVAAGSFGLGHPLTCAGRNLAYRKEAFQESGGFRKIGSFISGDDDLLMRQIRSRTRWEMTYNLDPESSVPSRPPGNWKSFINQRIRHASKGFHYNPLFTAGLIIVYLFYLSLLLAPLFSATRLTALILFLLKVLLETRLILPLLDRFDLKKLIPVFPVAFLLHIPYVVLFGLLGQVLRFSWKDQRSSYR